MVPMRPIGEMLRAWRLHRRLSQLELSLEVGIFRCATSALSKPDAPRRAAG